MYCDEIELVEFMTNYIILRRRFDQEPDSRLLILTKMLRQYFNYIPVEEVSILFSDLELSVTDFQFQRALEMLWGHALAMNLPTRKCN